MHSHLHLHHVGNPVPGELGATISVVAWAALACGIIFTIRYLTVIRRPSGAGKALLIAIGALSIALVVPAVKYTWPAWTTTHTEAFLWINVLSRGVVVLSLAGLWVSFESLRHSRAGEIPPGENASDAR